MDWQIAFSIPVNGRVRRADVEVFSGGKVLHTDRVDMMAERDRLRFCKSVAGKVEEDLETVTAKVGEEWSTAYQRHREAAAAGGTAPGPDACTVEVLDAYPETVSRPLCLVTGQSYAAAWLPVRHTVSQTVDEATGDLVTYDPPRVQVGTRRVIVRDDGRAFGDGVPLPGCRPEVELGAAVALETAVEARHAWGGAGVKRYLAGERRDPADVLRRVAGVVDHFMDFRRSLASQETMCRFAACSILATYFLDALDVTGYLWPNGDKGSGKTRFLDVYAEVAYLGHLILAGGSYAALRDVADYGATLAFDDAEAVMDLKKSDPDKRALLLAGNRRGATVPVKELVGERWVIRYVRAFCPRLFSAIKLPDEVLASRTIIVPLVRSPDAAKVKRNVSDHATWPCDHRRLLDDLWAVGLAHLPRLRGFDAEAAGRAGLAGRDLEPWRGVLAVALWLEGEGVPGLFAEMEALSRAYQGERGGLEVGDATRLMVFALAKLARAWWKSCLPGGEEQPFTFAPSDLANCMGELASENENSEEGRKFSPKSIGWICRKLRLSRSTNDNKKRWAVTPEQVEALAQAYGLGVCRGDLDADEEPGQGPDGENGDAVSPAAGEGTRCPLPLAGEVGSDPF
jgi:hypothetical protein